MSLQYKLFFYNNKDIVFFFCFFYIYGVIFIKYRQVFTILVFVYKLPIRCETLNFAPIFNITIVPILDGLAIKYIIYVYNQSWLKLILFFFSFSTWRKGG